MTPSSVAAASPRGGGGLAGAAYNKIPAASAAVTAAAIRTPITVRHLQPPQVHPKGGNKILYWVTHLVSVKTSC